MSRELPDAPWFEILREETALKIRMYGDLEPIAAWVPPGLQYEGESAGIKLPTFTRPIWRSIGRCFESVEERFVQVSTIYLRAEVSVVRGLWGLAQGARILSGIPDGISKGPHQEVGS